MSPRSATHDGCSTDPPHPAHRAGGADDAGAAPRPADAAAGWTGSTSGALEADSTTPIADPRLLTLSGDREAPERTGSSARAARAGSASTPLARILTPLALPLYFVIMMSVAYVSALHAPAPRHAPLVLAGPQQVVSQLATGLDAAAPGAFDVTTTTDAGAARDAVLQTDAIGAVVVAADGAAAPQVTAYVAGGGGQSQVSAVSAVASQIATQVGTTATTQDLAPLTPGDRTGTGLFYLLIVSTIAGYLTVTVLSQAAPGLRLRTTYTVIAGTAVLGPALSMALMSIFVGSYGASAGQLLATYGVAALYTLTAGTVAVFVTQLLGRAAIFGLMLVMVFLNFPAAGGGVPVAKLPTAWQWVHAVWLGSAGMEAFRSIIYFNGNGLGRWLLQLGVWAVVALTASLTLGRTVTARRAHAAGDPATGAVAAVGA